MQCVHCRGYQHIPNQNGKVRMCEKATYLHTAGYVQVDEFLRTATICHVGNSPVSVVGTVGNAQVLQIGTVSGHGANTVSELVIELHGPMKHIFFKTKILTYI